MEANMADNKGKQVVFTNVGENDHLPYSKADITKVSRVSDSYSLSFYQIDYQAMAMKMALPELLSSSTSNSSKELLISVGKIVLDKNGFQQLLDEMTQIKQKIEQEGNK